MLVNLTEKEPFANIYGIFDHFSRSYEVTMFGMVRRCLDVSDVILAKEHK